MPYPTHITREAVIATARDLIEADGLEQMSLSHLAAALNVKAPSLYRYFDGKTALLRAVNEVTERELMAAITAAIQPDAPARDQIVAAMLAYRAFAHRCPVTYQARFTALNPELRPDPTVSEQSALPLQAIMARLSGAADSLAALRGAMALAHGYVTMEINGQFQRGGNLDATYRQIVEVYLDGWQSHK